MSSETEFRSVKGTRFAAAAYVDMDDSVCTTEEQDDSPEERVGVDVMFSNERTPFYYYTKSVAKMKCSVSENTVTYNVPGNPDLISYSYLCFTTPRLNIKKEWSSEYQIRFNKYLGYSISPSAMVTTPNNKELSSINSIYCVKFIQHHAGERQASYARRAGRVGELCNWNTILESRELTPHQPWWYSSRPFSAFPLYRIKPDNGNNIQHIYELELDVVKHLLMRRYVNGKWVDIPVDTTKIEGLPVDKKFEIPGMYAVFYKITNHEKRNIHDNINPYYIDTIVDCNKKKSIGYSNTVSSSIDTDKMLCKVMHLAMQNDTARVLGDPFNFTTNSSDSSKGKMPIAMVESEYGKTVSFSLSAAHFDGPLSDENFDSTPLEEGYVAYSFPIEASSPGANIGIFPESMKMKLSSTLVTKRKEFTDDQFKMKINLVVTRGITIGSTGEITIIDTDEV